MGEILLQHRWCGEDDLAIVLADQRIAGKRTCSLLIVRGVIGPDIAARALAEQFGCSAALMKHLDNRDRTLEKLLPSNFARQHYALPLGRMRDGEIVICVRDPKPGLQQAFEKILEKPVLITVAAAHTLEPLIEMTYAPVVTQEISVKFRASQQFRVPEPPPPPTELAAGTVRNTGGVVEEEIDVDLNSAAMPTPVPGSLVMPEEFSLVDLDDAGVSRDFSQVGPPAGRQPTLPPANVTRTPAKKP